MRMWSDLSWYEKCRIRSGSVNSYSYMGDSFQVKQEVEKGKRKRMDTPKTPLSSEADLANELLYSEVELEDEADDSEAWPPTREGA